MNYRLVDGMDHLLRVGQGPSAPDQYKQTGHVDGEVIRLISAWIKSMQPAHEPPPMRASETQLCDRSRR